MNLIILLFNKLTRHSVSIFIYLFLNKKNEEKFLQNYKYAKELYDKYKHTYIQLQHLLNA